ncbi:DUF3967 domain-containing protein [Pseudobacillus badius]|uniref:DUF3967 domain-containing protein n=1 Tax=Bacillus badius TaxID=1455 RepID=UPI0007B09BD1|nr:DUF3967 domain-containing protein [Bacillus badius]KZO00622.1 hypothetical protein A4244_15020 [Bacillus badius]OCS87863.1 hypothetical protein A6M11_15040 [Bacillus badius]OVE47182.1 hypothetical protein B1A98_18735 [Bacillus badius]TDV98980.1 MerR-like DNA binding protein [Bacillus badius]
MSEYEKAYTTKEISLTLDIGSSTLRKWCLALEEKGYQFARTDNQRRLFVEKDLVALRYFQKLVQGENFSLENAAKVIASRYKEEASETRTPPVLDDEEQENTPAVINQRSLIRSEDVINRLLNHIETQETFMREQQKYNEELKLELQKTQKELQSTNLYIKERLEERDKVLMESLKASQEAKKEMLQTAAAAKEEEKKGFWSRLLGK